MIRSMTGYAAQESAHTVAGCPWSASWDLRAVNAKGLDIRLRMPDWVPGLEAAARKALTSRLGRGSVSLSLRLGRAETSSAGVNPQALSDTLSQMKQIAEAAADRGVTLAAPTALDLLSIRGIADVQDLSPEAAKELSTALQSDLPALIDHFLSARLSEGQALHQVLHVQIDGIAALMDQIADATAARAEAQEAALRRALQAVTQSTEFPEERIAQELALIATKSDITEEIDRLHAHIQAARDLLNDSNPVGRKLDFLCQEFNREANTLCSKSGDTRLTQAGLELKTRIEQFREQVQNVE